VAVHATALTTLTSLKSVGIAAADTSKDTLLEQYIDRATQWIEGRTERKLKARNYNGFNASGEGSDFDHKTSSSGDTVPSENYLFFDGHAAVKDDKGFALFYLSQFPIVRVSGSNRNAIHHPNAVTFRIQELTNLPSRGRAMRLHLEPLDQNAPSRSRFTPVQPGAWRRRSENMRSP
jgi:hypothetical protein